MIPKKIHYCWFGKNKKNEIIEKCIQSWKIHCPDWEIIEWNEDNFDVTSIQYMKEAYECKKYAFVSDVARLLIVYQSGGIYLDTDVELLDNIEFLLDNEAFYFFESERNIATGLGFGAEKNHKSVNQLLNYYNNKCFVINQRMDLTPCPNNNTNMLKKCYSNFKRNGIEQSFEGCTVYSVEEYKKIMKHYGTATWVEGEKTDRKFVDSKFKRFLREPKNFEIVESIFGDGFILKVYTFCAYDLMENGIYYYIKRLINKWMRE